MLPVVEADIMDNLNWEQREFVGLLFFWLLTALLMVFTLRARGVRVRSEAGLALLGLVAGAALAYNFLPAHVVQHRDWPFWPFALACSSAFNCVITIAVRWSYSEPERKNRSSVGTVVAVVGFIADAAYIKINLLGADSLSYTILVSLA